MKLFDRRTKSVGNWECWVFVCMVLLLQLPGLMRGFSLDEYKTLMVTRLSWADLLQDRLASGHLPTYFSIVKAWTGLAGDSEVIMRLPGLLLTALSVIFLYKFAHRIAGVGAARWCGALFALHQGVAWCGQTARPYGGVMLASMALYWAAAEWWHSRNRMWIVVMALAGLGGIAFMPLAGLLPLALALATLPAFRGRFSLAWPVAAGCAAAIAVGMLPSALLASSQTKLQTGRAMHWPDFPKLIEGLCNSVFGDYGLWARGGFQYLAGAVLAGAVVALWWGRLGGLTDRKLAPEGPPWRSWLLLWILLPLLALILASAVTGESMVSQQRYRIPALGGLIVLLGVAMDRIMRFEWAKGARYGVAVLVMVPMALTTAAWWRFPGEGVKPVVHAVLAEAGGIPAQLAGHARWFRLETPKGQAPERELLLERAIANRNEEFIEGAMDTGTDVEVMHYEKDSDDISAVRQKLTDWSHGRPFWLFVYIQRNDALDRVAKNPPDGFEAVKKISAGYARAYLFKPLAVGN